MAQPTPEALTWDKRANGLEAGGIIVGAREICPDCERPLGAWGTGKARIQGCVCGSLPLYVDAYTPHGLDSLIVSIGRTQHGDTTYG